MLNINQQKGISIFFVTMMMSVILAVALGVSTIVINQSRMMSEMGYSVAALSAADSGIEKRLYNLYHGEAPYESFYEPECLEGEDYYFENSLYCGKDMGEECPLNLEVSADCQALNFCLRSIGSYKGVQRAIEINY